MSTAFDPDAFETADDGEDEVWEPSVTIESDDFDSYLCFDHSPPNFHSPFPDIELGEEYEYRIEVDETVEDLEVKEASGNDILDVEVEELGEEAYQVYLEAKNEGETGLEHIISDREETISSDYESDSFSVYAVETGSEDEYEEEDHSHDHTHEHNHDHMGEETEYPEEDDTSEEPDTDLDDVDEALEGESEDMETVESDLEDEGYDTEESYNTAEGAGAGGAFGAIGAAVYALALL